MEIKLRRQIPKEFSEVLRSIKNYLICNITTFDLFRNSADMDLDN